MINNREKEKLKITPQNYEGYCELYKAYFYITDESDKLLIPILKALAASTLILIVIAVLTTSAAVFSISAVAVIGTTLGTFAVTDYKIVKSKKDSIINKYPNIDIKVSLNELKNALKEVNILKYDDKCIKLDIEGYRNYIECDNIKNEIIDDYKYKLIDMINYIPEKQLEKTKVKVKTMIKNRDL